MFYSTIGLVAIIIHLILNHEYLKIKKGRDKVSKAFTGYVVAALLYYISDALWGIIYDLNIPVLLYVDTLLYYATMALTVVLLCRYVTGYLHLNNGFGVFVEYFGYVFAFAEFLMLVINHSVHIFFWITPDGNYQAYTMRYVALYVQVFLCVMLAIQTGTVLKSATNEKRKRYFTIFLFCIEMTAAIIFQIVYPLLPLYSIGLVIGFSIIHTFVNENENEEQYKTLMSMADIYYSMHVINLDDDTVQAFNAKDEVKEVVNHREGAIEMMHQIMSLVTVEEYLDKALAFTDLTTLKERMKNKKAISSQFIGKNTGWFLAMFIAIETNSEGEPSKVIYTTRVIDEEKKQEEKLIFNSQIDGLTGLYNRRAYEDDLLNYPSVPTEADFVYASIDVNGLKVVNDNLGHEAGDELLKGAAECLKRTLGHYGKVYRTGGDEFISMFFADEVRLKEIAGMLENETIAWRGNLVDTLSLSVGYASKREFSEETVANMAKIADQRMYQAKKEYYSRKGVDRRGQAAAHTALCNLYTKILKINLTDDSYSIVNMDMSEQTIEKGFADTISQWLSDFGNSGQVHEDDLERYLQKTNLNYLKEYFESGETYISIYYKRKYASGYKDVSMEMIRADDYSSDNQTLFLYVKAI